MRQGCYGLSETLKQELGYNRTRYTATMNSSFYLRSAVRHFWMMARNMPWRATTTEQQLFKGDGSLRVWVARPAEKVSS